MIFFGEFFFQYFCFFHFWLRIVACSRALPLSPRLLPLLAF